MRKEELGIMRDWVKIDTSTAFASNGEQSPVVKCLLHENTDRKFFKKQVSMSINNTIIDDTVLEEKVNKIIEWRNMLHDKFGNQKAQRELCIRSLGHLIAARYSGKAQSYDAIGYTLTKLSNAMTDKNPITFTFCFGGYKCHTSPAHPQVDWAELFNMNYLVSYLYPIIKSYEYGVIIEYESEEVSIQFNNVPQERTDQYTDSFKKLVNYYVDAVNKKYDLSLSIRLVIARDLYNVDISELYRLIDDNKQKYYDFFEQLSDKEREKWIQRAESNFMWEGGIKKYGELTAEERYEIYKDARIINEAFLDADYFLRESWFEDPYRIPLTGTWGIMTSAQPIDGWLHIKSTASSKVDCWIGTGFLEKVSKKGTIKYNEMILSKSQIQALGEKIYYIPNDDDMLKSISPNFDQVPVYDKEE